MLKISHTEAVDGKVRLHLEGSLAGQWVGEARRICRAIMGRAPGLRIDLSDVHFVDRKGVQLLAGLKKRKAVLDHCSPFLSAQLDSIR